MPNYDWWEGPFYGIGLKIYDVLAGKEGFGKSEILSREKTLTHIPTVEAQGLKCGVIYYDGQFDDARLAVNLAQTAWENGAVLVNYLQSGTALTKKGGFIEGVVAHGLWKPAGSIPSKPGRWSTPQALSATESGTWTIRPRRA